MSWQEILNLVAAFFVSGLASTVVVQFIKNVRWKDLWKMVLTIAVSILVGFAQAWVAGAFFDLSSWGELTASEIIALVGIVFAGASTYYKVFFKGAAWMARLEAMLWGAAEE